MIDLEKLHQVMRLVASEKGDFTLFGIFLRAEAPDKWDLVLAAPWLDEGKLKALEDFVKHLSSVLGEEEILTLSRIVTVNRDDPALDAILRAVQVDDGPVTIKDSIFFGLEIKEAHIFRARRPSEPRPARAT